MTAVVHGSAIHRLAQVRVRWLPLIFVLGAICGGFSYLALIVFLPEELADEITVGILANTPYLAVVLWIAYRARLRPSAFRELYARPDERIWGWIGVAVWLMLFSTGTAVLQTEALRTLFPDIDALLLELYYPIDPRRLGGLLDVLAIVIVAPFAEELICRGVVLNRWREKWSLRTGVVASSICFGLPHFPDLIGATVY